MLLKRECDDILMALKNSPPRLTTWNIDTLYQRTQIPFDTIKDALAVLRTDKVIDDNNGMLEINDLGRILLLKGGYSAKDFEEYEYEKLKTSQDRMAKELSGIQKKNLWINRAIAVWTGIAAVYYLLEVLNHFFCIYSH
jgi:hypothetical protein